MRVTENSALHVGEIRHPHRLGRLAYVDDEIFLHPHGVRLRHAWFFNSAPY
jgi:hypothetical protein